MTAGQASRNAAVSSSLAADELLLRRLVANERVNRSFTYELELLSENFTISPKSVLGEHMTVAYDLPGGGTRYFDGLVSQFSSRDSEGRYARYTVRVDSWLWFLTHSSNCRIFQGKSVPEIVKDVFGTYSVAKFEDRLTASYRTWDYCVQYRETDYNFVNRLLEHEGIFYFFEHSKGKHTLVLADSDTEPLRVADYDSVPYFPPEIAGLRERDHISRWVMRQEVRSGAFVQRDFDFEKPRANLETQRQSPGSYSLGSLELYDYPGIYLTADDGDTLSRIRLEETQAEGEVVEGEGDVAGLLPGAAFKLTGYPRDDQNREYRVLATELELTAQEYETRATGAGGATCQCALIGMDAQRPFRPKRVTPKPTVVGPQTAIVTGPGGEEIWTDKYGRVKVQFHWDRQGKKDENSSCWVRVSHPWAGKSWGAVSIPRIGQEVIVEFLEGDPDRPIITGRVYNADTMPPYALPAGAVISGIKSDSTKGSGGYNEYVMDDTKGNELIREHGQYDKDSTIEHDLREHVLNNRSRDVKVDEKVFVGQDQSVEIGRDQSIQVDQDRKLLVQRDKSETVLRNKMIKIVGDHSEQIGGAMAVLVGSSLTQTVAINIAETVGGAKELNVGAALAVSVGAALAEQVGGTKTETIGSTKTETVGNDKSMTIGGDLAETIRKGQTVKIDKNLKEEIGENHEETVTKDYVLRAKSIQVIGEDKVTIKTGSAEIMMQSNGDITIKGQKINIKGSGDVIIKGSKISEN